jgi:phage terminase large subunit GpA-like protein
VLGAASAVEVGPMGRKIKSGVKIWPVNVNFVKEELYRWLNLDVPDLEAGEAYPDGFCHFPQYNREYFAQLTAEQLVTITDKHGYRKTQWQKMRDRNEALDLAVYNRAASVAWGIDRMEEKHWAHLEELLGARKQRLEEALRAPNTVTPEQPATQVAAPVSPAAGSPRRRIRFRFN